VIGVTEFEGVVRGHGAGWMNVWLGSHVTRVRSWSGVDSPTINPNIEAYALRNSVSGSYVVVCWRHTVNLKQTNTWGFPLSVKTRKRKDLDLKNYHSSPC
jgi:hypothetical protein